MPSKYDDVEITMFASTEEFRTYDVRDEGQIAEVIRRKVLPREKAKYHSVKVKVNRKADGSPRYLVAYLLRKDTYTADVVRVDVDAAYRVKEFKDDYYEAEEEAEPGREEEEPPGTAKGAPGESYAAVDFVAATPVPEIATAKLAAETVHELALAAGLNSKLLLGADASVANYKLYLASGLRGFVNVGHGNTNEIVLADGRLPASWFQGLGKRLCPAVVYFNSCQVFNAPLQPAVMNAGARTFIGGITNLLIGASEEVCKCFWENVLAKGASMSVLTECEKAKYPTTGAHSISGDLGLFNFITSAIDTYKVVLYGKNQTPEALVAFIHCFQGANNVVTCEFYADGSAVPDNRYGGCRVGLGYPWSRFDGVLDVLRNEKPVYYGFIFSTKVGYIATQAEPVGEGEALRESSARSRG
jgi:hypothetical protein